jgi:hypothetical protein
VNESEFLKGLLAAGAPIIWAPPQLDGDGNWLPQIYDRETESWLDTGTWKGYNLPRWKDPATRTLHEIRSADHLDELLAREPRPAFFLLTGFVLDGIDLDRHSDVRHSDVDHHALIRAAVEFPVARVRTPSGGEHLLVASSGQHNSSNTHSQCDYRGVNGILALPGTYRSTNGSVTQYEALEWNPGNMGIIPDSALALFDEFAAERRRCNECAVSALANGTGHGGIPLGDGSGWDILEEEATVFDPDDPFGLPTTKELAEAVLTWEELLSPWFNVVGRQGSNLYLIRAGKAVEGRDGKSAVLHCADSRLVAYSSDLPLALGTQLSKLDVFCAIKEHESPGQGEPEDFAERLKWMRDRWAGLIYSERGYDVPRHLRVKCADEKVARAPSYPVLADEFWEAHPVLKRIRAETEPHCVSPEAVLMCVMLRVLLHIGPQVVLPPKSGTNPEAGVTLNAGGMLLAGYGEGKGAAEHVADLYVPSKRMQVKAASGQAFAFMFGHLEKPKKKAAGEEVDPLEDGTSKFVRTHWSRYLQYDEMDEFEAQMNMQNSTLSPVLRSVLTTDRLEERVAIGRDSRLPTVEGFRLVFVAHGQPTRLDWLLNGQASGGFPQRLWYVYAASERPAEEYLDPDFEAPDIEPLDLVLPQGWGLPDSIHPDKPKVCVPVPKEARYQARTWQYDAPEDDKRGMLNVRLRAYAAMLVMMPDLPHDDIWKLAVDFHSLCYRTRQYALQLIKKDAQRRVAVQTTIKVQEQRALTKAKHEDDIEQVTSAVRARVLEMLAEGPRSRRQMAQGLSGARRAYLDSVLVLLEGDQLIVQRDGKYDVR